MDAQQPQQQEGEEGERGLKSFLSNVVHNATSAKVASTPDLDADVAKLDAAFKGVGTKEDQLIAVMCSQTKERMQKLRIIYDQSHTMDLLSKIQLETSGRFQTIFEALLVTEPELRALHINKAVKGVGTDEMALIDLVITMDNKMVRETKAAYKKHFLIPMQLRVDLDTSGRFQGVLDAILNEKRPEGGIQKELVETDLETLFKSTEGKLGTDEKAILNIIASRSPEHLQHLNEAYKARSPKQRTFVQELKVEMSGMFWMQKAYVAAFMGPVSWHAWRLYGSMNGLGTDEKALMRSILVPAQKDIRAAARVLQEVYKMDLVKAVNGDLWGDVRRALVAYVTFCLSLPDTGAVAQAGPLLTEPTAAAQEEDKKQWTTGQKVGLGVGIGAGVLAAGAIAAGVGLAVHNKNEKKEEAAAAAAGGSKTKTVEEDKKDEKKKDKGDDKDKKKKDKKGSDSEGDEKKEKKEKKDKKDKK